MEILIIAMSVYSVILLTSYEKKDFWRGLISASFSITFLSNYLYVNHNNKEILENTQYLGYFIIMILVLEIYRNFARRR